MASSGRSCFHCGEPVPADGVVLARIDGREEAVCCHGCKAVAELISGAGLTRFYRFRTAAGARPDGSTCREDAWTSFDRSPLFEELTHAEPGGRRSVGLLLEGLRCAACAWLIDKMLIRLPGVTAVGVNAATGRARVVWDPQVARLSGILGRIAELGYRPHPLTPEAVDTSARDERRGALKRLAVAGLGMMQVMMFAVALYTADGTMTADVHAYLRIVSMLVSTPVLLYSGWPFFASAANAIRRRTIGMDVPVSLALVLAYSASVLNTLRDAGEIYFDSVTMFVFFLTLGRFIEMSARHRTNSVGDALARLTPVTAKRLRGASTEEVRAVDLDAGDRVLVRAGEILPADGVVDEGSALIDESMLTGESRPVARRPGDAVCAGTRNLFAPLVVQVTAVGAATMLRGIVSLLDRAQSERPRLARAADRAASWFLGRILLGAALVCGAWVIVDPTRALDATLAVLVVTCPCALSLATPTAIAAVTARLATRGVLVTRSDAIEALSRSNRVVLDKTGTLSHGALRLERCQPLADLSEQDCRRIAAALEGASEHPLACAFELDEPLPWRASAVRILPGSGLEGSIEGCRYRMGNWEYVSAPIRAAGAVPPPMADDDWIFLGDEEQLLAGFQLVDSVRGGAPAVCRELSELGLALEIQSGDSERSVQAMAQRVGIERYAGRRTPELKLERIRQLRSQGDRVVMVGDGINDGPVLRAADVSVAMGGGSSLALASADIVLMADSLEGLTDAVRSSRLALTIVRQNLLWAAAYNLTALPLAALGYVPPWLAAIGMSVSSVAVVLNAWRVGPHTRSRIAASDSSGRTAALGAS